MEVIAKPEEYGTVVPSNITSGPFVQLAADNNDLNEETLNGKNTTHATTMVVYQQKPFGPEPSTITVADHSVKRRSLQSTSKVYDIQECSAHGWRPAASAYISEVEAKCTKKVKIVSRKPLTDKIWSLMRVNPTSLRDATEHAEVQKIPGWSGFNAILYPEMPQESNIGYCPMIDGASTEFSTVYKVLKHVQMLSSALGQGDAVITFDLLMYMKAKQIQ